jgi:uncharacterized membrane protein YvlD (DUF360 family)
MTRNGDGPARAYGDELRWSPEVPKFRLIRFVTSVVVLTPAVLISAWILPGVDVPNFWGALLVALAVVVLNMIVPPLLAAIRLPLTLVAGFLLILIADALMFKLASDWFPGQFHVDNFGWALLMALLTSAVALVIEIILGANDDDEYSLRVVNRIAKRSGERVETDVPGIIYLEIDGLALPVLQRAMRDGNAPNMARWVEDGSHHMTEWETDLSSQTGASQSGILLGSNENIPAFRWVEKENGRLMTCSAPPDCAELERRHSTGIGLLRDGGAEPRQPALRRGRPRDPHRQPDRGGEEVESRLPRVLRERLQRHADARPLLLRGGARAGRGLPLEAPRRAPARPSRPDVRVHARGDVRGRPRPDRLRRPHGHDEGAPRDVRERSPRTTRSPTTPGSSGPTRSRRCASSTSSSAASTARAATRRAPTRSSCSPTTARRRARPSSSATATRSRISSTARSPTRR